MDSSSVSELKYESEDTKITLRKTSIFAEKAMAVTSVQTVPVQNAATQVVPQPAVSSVPAKDTTAEEDETDPSLHPITAPMVGTFYASSSPDVDTYVKKGSKVDKQTVVCIVEAMKLFNEIEAECKGTIVAILAEDGQLVEYGQPLFLVKED